MKNTSFRLPNDLEKYERHKKAIGAVVTSLVTVTAVGIFIMLLIPYHNASYEHILLLCAVYLLLIAAIAFGFKIPKRYIDNTFFGNVTDISVHTSEAPDSVIRIATKSKNGWHTEHILHLKIECRDGQIIDHKIVSSGNHSAQGLGKYSVGDTVFHLYGTKVTVRLPLAKDENVACPVCGAENHKENGKCRICKHTLITALTFENTRFGL